MKHSTRNSAPVLALALSGCLFGGKEPDPIVVDGNVATNNATTNNATTNNGTNGALDIAPADVEILECEPNATVFVTDDGVPSGYEIDDASFVGFDGGPVRVPLMAQPFTAGVTWAKVVGGELRITVGATRQNPATLPATTSPEEYWTVSTPVAEGTEVLGIDFGAHGVTDSTPDGMPVLLYEVNVATTAGVQQCNIAYVGQEILGACGESFVQQQFDSVAVNAPEGLDYALLLTPSGSTLTVDLANPPLMFGSAGRGRNDNEYLGLVTFDPQSTSFSAVPTAGAVVGFLEPPERYAPRFAWGVGEAERGWPAVQVLARDADGADYRPRVLVRDGSSYGELDVGSWPLPPVAIGRRNFTFLDGYDVDAAVDLSAGADGPIEFVVNMALSEALYGWAALSDDGGRLYLSRPGGIAGADVVEAALGPNAVEVYAARNFPLVKQFGTVAYPFMIIVDGAERDRVALAQWDFGTDVQILPDAFAGRFSDVASVVPPILFDGGVSFGGSVLPFRARAEGRLGVGLFPFAAGASASSSSRFDASVCADR